MHGFLEILVIVGVKQYPYLKPFIVDLLQGYRRTGHILGKVLTESFIGKPHAVAYTET